MSGSEDGRSPRGLGVVSDKPQPQVPVQRNGGGAGRELKKEQQRLKREDHVYVKHDDCFSDWKILVGPTDWREHASGKIPDRFRISNLPSKHTGAGLYELGVTPPAWLPLHNLSPHDVVVVYLGSAENVYQRLLKYGQTGAHLEGIRSTRLFAVRAEERDVGDGGYVSRPVSNTSLDANEDGGLEVKGDHARSPGRGSRLFSEVFALGCSVTFRWTLADSKADAERAEALLNSHFDYAWKRGGNFRQRSSDILSKVVGSHSPSSPSSCFTWLFSTRPGVRIPARKPSEPPTPRPFTLFRTTTLTATKSSKQREFTKLDIPVDRCGAPSCHALPVKGGKRCLLHKDLKSKSAIAPNPNPNPHTDSNLLEGVESPIFPGPEPRPAPISSCFPFFSPAIAAPSSSSSPKRRGSLSFTSWLRTSEIRMSTRAETGPKRSSTLTTCDENESPSSRSRREICGLRLEDGTVCPDTPRPDRKRCEAHKGLRNQAPRSPRSAAMSPARSAPMSPNAGFF